MMWVLYTPKNSSNTQISIGTNNDDHFYVIRRLCEKSWSIQKRSSSRFQSVSLFPIHMYRVLKWYPLWYELDVLYYVVPIVVISWWDAYLFSFTFPNRLVNIIWLFLDRLFYQHMIIWSHYNYFSVYLS